ncbi:FAD binding domain-containing protein [Bradyrhizobium sp. CCBAU 11445]|uniref:FAD binding domain-containing protein n=1 Tax=Bradyrhizobium sp. CCBAU 11445 TaxID=1630896 RepID=UPI002305433B|nr:FAD binding domain-containing protein [Bradyrhizobium sp. CCBAU 11445]
MRELTYTRATTVEEASALASRRGAMLIAGGTTLLDLAKCDVLQPDALIDVTWIPGLDSIRVDEEGAKIRHRSRQASRCGALNRRSLAAFAPIAGETLSVTEPSLLPRSSADLPIATCCARSTR